MGTGVFSRPSTVCFCGGRICICEKQILIYKIQTTELVGACRKNDQLKSGQDHIQMETVCNKTEGKAKSKIGRRCEEWFEEDGSE